MKIDGHETELIYDIDSYEEKTGDSGTIKYYTLQFSKTPKGRLKELATVYECIHRFGKLLVLSIDISNIKTSSMRRKILSFLLRGKTDPRIILHTTTRDILSNPTLLKAGSLLLDFN